MAESTQDWPVVNITTKGQVSCGKNNPKEKKKGKKVCEVWTRTIPPPHKKDNVKGHGAPQHKKVATQHKNKDKVKTRTAKRKKGATQHQKKDKVKTHTPKHKK